LIRRFISGEFPRNATNVASNCQGFPPYEFTVAVNKAKVYEMICSQVALLLKAEREQQNLSLNLLAAKAGLSRQTISFIEQEERTPNLETLLRITSALEIDLEKIIAQARKQAQAK
jgi:DNA-binding XRE family transcriptional regulator